MAKNGKTTPREYREALAASLGMRLADGSPVVVGGGRSPSPTAIGEGAVVAAEAVVAAGAVVGVGARVGERARDPRRTDSGNGLSGDSAMSPVVVRERGGA